MHTTFDSININFEACFIRRNEKQKQLPIEINKLLCPNISA